MYLIHSVPSNNLFFKFLIQFISSFLQTILNCLGLLYFIYIDSLDNL